MSSRKKSLFIWGMLIILSIVWGSASLLIKRALLVLSAEEVTLVRISSAFIVLLPMSLYMLRRIRFNQYPKLLLVGLLGPFLPSFLFAFAQQHIDSAICGVLNALSVVFIQVIGMLFFGTSRKIVHILGSILGSIAVVFLILATKSPNGLTCNYYILLPVVACLCYGLHANIMKYKLRDIAPWVSTVVSFLPYGIISVVWLIYSPAFWTKVYIVRGAWVSIGYAAGLGIFGTAIAYLIYNQLIKLVTPVFASTVHFLAPIVSVILGCLDGEILVAGHYIGLLILFISLWLINKK